MSEQGAEGLDIQAMLDGADPALVLTGDAFREDAGEDGARDLWFYTASGTWLERFVTVWGLLNGSRGNPPRREELGAAMVGVLDGVKAPFDVLVTATTTGAMIAEDMVRAAGRPAPPVHVVSRHREGTGRLWSRGHLDAQRVVIVTDVVSTGALLRSLLHYVLREGGEPVAVVTVALALAVHDEESALGDTSPTWVDVHVNPAGLDDSEETSTPTLRVGSLVEMPKGGHAVQLRGARQIPLVALGKTTVRAVREMPEGADAAIVDASAVYPVTHHVWSRAPRLSLGSIVGERAVANHLLPGFFRVGERLVNVFSDMEALCERAAAELTERIQTPALLVTTSDSRDRRFTEQLGAHLGEHLTAPLPTRADDSVRVFLRREEHEILERFMALESHGDVVVVLASTNSTARLRALVTLLSNYSRRGRRLLQHGTLHIRCAVSRVGVETAAFLDSPAAGEAQPLMDYLAGIELPCFSDRQLHDLYSSYCYVVLERPLATFRTSFLRDLTHEVGVWLEPRRGIEFEDRDWSSGGRNPACESIPVHGMSVDSLSGWCVAWLRLLVPHLTPDDPPEHLPGRMRIRWPTPALAAEILCATEVDTERGIHPPPEELWHVEHRDRALFLRAVLVHLVGERGQPGATGIVDRVRARLRELLRNSSPMREDVCARWGDEHVRRAEVHRRAVLLELLAYVAATWPRPKQDIDDFIEFALPFNRDGLWVDDHPEIFLAHYGSRRMAWVIGLWIRTIALDVDYGRVLERGRGSSKSRRRRIRASEAIDISLRYDQQLCRELSRAHGMDALVPWLHLGSLRHELRGTDRPRHSSLRLLHRLLYRPPEAETALIARELDEMVEPGSLSLDALALVQAATSAAQHVVEFSPVDEAQRERYGRMGRLQRLVRKLVQTRTIHLNGGGPSDSVRSYIQEIRTLLVENTFRAGDGGHLHGIRAVVARYIVDLGPMLKAEFPSLNVNGPEELWVLCDRSLARSVVRLLHELGAVRSIEVEEHAGSRGRIRAPGLDDDLDDVDFVFDEKQIASVLEPRRSTITLTVTYAGRMVGRELDCWRHDRSLRHYRGRIRALEAEDDVHRVELEFKSRAHLRDLLAWSQSAEFMETLDEGNVSLVFDEPRSLFTEDWERDFADVVRECVEEPVSIKKIEPMEGGRETVVVLHGFSEAAKNRLRDGERYLARYDYRPTRIRTGDITPIANLPEADMLKYVIAKLLGNQYDVNELRVLLQVHAADIAKRLSPDLSLEQLAGSAAVLLAEPSHRGFLLNILTAIEDERPGAGDDVGQVRLLLRDDAP